MVETGVSRRSFIRATGLFAAAATSGLGVAGCSAFGRAFIETNWLQQIATGVVAAEIASQLEGALSESWAGWEQGRNLARQIQFEQGWGSFSTVTYADGVPPALFFGAQQTPTMDPKTDRLVVCVNDGTGQVVFEPWQWQALSLFIQELTIGKDGDEKAGFQALCKISLFPSGTVTTSLNSASGRTGVLSYRTRNGDVEMVRTTTENRETIVQVICTGIPNRDGNPTTREFLLPTVFV